MNSSPLVRVSRKRPCPVCGKHNEACSTRADGVLAICTQAISPHPAGGCRTAWTHILTSSNRAPQPIISTKQAKPAPEAAPLAPIERRHAVHASLLHEHLVLAAEHAADLQRRGLSAHAIGCNDYKSTPPPAFANNIARTLSGRYDLTGVPGFYLEHGKWRMIKMQPGFLCPYRDRDGRIQAMQYRLDVPIDGRKYIWLSSRGFNAGTSSSTPLHVAGRAFLAGSADLLVTEGSLKADLIAVFLSVPVVAGGGVTCFGENFGVWFKTEFPTKRAVICFDSDWAVKREVKTALQRLRTQLRAAGVPFVVRTWPAEFKGLDDYLLACSLDQFSAQEVAA